jgi:hypothetical protein
MENVYKSIYKKSNKTLHNNAWGCRLSNAVKRDQKEEITCMVVLRTTIKPKRISTSHIPTSIYTVLYYISYRVSISAVSLFVLRRGIETKQTGTVRVPDNNAQLVFVINRHVIRSLKLAIFTRMQQYVAINVRIELDENKRSTIETININSFASVFQINGEV